MNTACPVQWRTVLLFAMVYMLWFGLTLASQQYTGWLIIPLFLLLTLLKDITWVERDSYLAVPTQD